jgi:hypothetical protein
LKIPKAATPPPPPTYKLVTTYIIRRQGRRFHILHRWMGPFSKQLFLKISHIRSKDFPFLPNVHLQKPASAVVNEKILSCRVVGTM